MSPENAKISKIFGEQIDEPEEEKSNLFSDPETEGQLALDAYQSESSVVIKAPIAGVKPGDIEVSMTEDSITIKGARKLEEQINSENYIAQECYWGAFSRQLSLPEGVDTERAKAALKNGVLTIIIPKTAKSQAKILKISTEE